MTRRRRQPENAGEKQANPAHFPPGTSGNPAGKPKGTRNKLTMALEQLLEGQAEAITQVCIDQALMGDPVAMRLIFERVMPVRRGRPVHFEFEPLKKAEDVSMMLGSILKAVATGELTPDEAATIATIAEAKRKAIETMDIERRLEELEAHQEDRTA